MRVNMLYPLHRMDVLARIGQGPHPVIAEIQQILAKQGLYSGEPDGVKNDKTVESILRYQSVHSLPATGLLDPLTYCSLHPSVSREVKTAEKTKREGFALPRANIQIIKSDRRLILLNGQTPLHEYPVAIGKPATPTPSGRFAIATKALNPGGVLGSRWMGLNYDTYGIHGTSSPWLIGQMVSHGCIRMHNSHAEELYALVNVGTPVIIRD